MSSGTAVSARTSVPWRFPTGNWAFLAGDRRAFCAAAIDALIVLAAGAVQYAIVVNSVFGTPAQAVASAILVAVATAWVYGFICFSGHTIGTLLCGTRIVKLRDGSAPGMLRGGWVMFVRTVVWVACPIGPPLAAPNTNGKNIPQCRRFHISILRKHRHEALLDDRTGLEATHGRTNDAHKYVAPQSTLPKVSMDSRFELVPSQFRDGSWGVQPQVWRIVLAWAVDLLLVFGLALASAPPGGASAAIIFVPAFTLLYGMFCFTGNTIGTLLAGTRIVRLKSGAAPGVWRGIWVMFYRIMLAWTAPLLFLAGLLDGTTGERDMGRAFHVSIDVRRTRELRGR
ncbi:hypothetical protein GCM10009715_29490 [Paeniglutamicibacter psychrophenolicus]|uniref:RDD domain-containing protein n=1 Tax=Paeniglutamicibacter psychrophenolicus TaxID=257454 RepID=A0ABS4W9D8_9MICC|nr:RDD family protein [Paeniglutamicibacter psychrophenolicus]MBP2372533.1 hypothetical protein [Paeniglutamicibacter psychrophenolicus]